MKLKSIYAVKQFSIGQKTSAWLLQMTMPIFLCQNSLPFRVKCNTISTNNTINKDSVWRIRYMMKWIKRAGVFLLAAVLLCSMGLASGETYAAEDTDEFQNISGEIEVVFNRGEADMRKYIDAFERKYPDVTVKYTAYSDLEKSVKRRMEEGDYGDVLYIPDFVTQNDLPKYFESLGNINKLEAKYNYIDAGKFLNYSVYGIPSSAYLTGIIYNKEIFHKAGISTLPETMDEYLYAMYLINEHTDAIPFYVGYQEAWLLQSWETFQFIEMTGNPSYKYGQFITEKEPFREGTVHYKALHFLYDLVEYGYTEVGRANINWNQSLTMLHNGELASVATGTWAFSSFKNAGEHGENIGFMPFPNTVDGRQYASLNVDYCYGVAKNSDNKEAAKAFVFFMVDESGYAFDHDTISALKSDPYPECYNGMPQTTMRNSMASSSTHYNQFLKLSSQLNLSDNSEYMKIIEAAAGISEQSFDEIMEDWNERWESSREDSMISVIKGDNSQVQEDNILNIDNRDVALSTNELQYILDNPVLRVGYHKNMAPLSFAQNGGFAGAAYDVFELIKGITNLEMCYIGYESTTALEAALLAGDIDVIAGMEKYEDNSNLRYSKEYLDYMDVLIRHSTVTADAQNAVATVAGEPDKNKEQVSSHYSYDSIGECIQRVQNMDADYTVTDYYSANYYVRERNCTDVTIVPYTPNKTYHIAFSEETNPTLIAICNKCIYSIQEGEMQISLMGYMDSVAKNISLQTFIRANPIQSIAIISCVFLIVIGAILWIFIEKDKANRKQALEAKKYEQLAALADESFFDYELSKKQLIFEASFRNVYGFEPVVDATNTGKRKVFIEAFLGQLEKAVEQKQNVRFTISLDMEDGSKLWYRVVTSIIYDKKEQPVHLIGKLVSIQKEMEEVATYQDKAYKDALTKIYNREGFRTSLPQEAENVTFAVMDVDNFKQVNDTLRHEGGDYALTYFAKSLRSVLGQDAILGRYGGDEFVALFYGVPLEEAKNRLDKLVKAMNVELSFGGNSRTISISVGAVFAPKMEDFGELFRQADEVLYETKKNGKNGYQIREYNI